MRTPDWCFCLMCDLQSHHRPRVGPFELNDVFAIINAVPAIALLSYGFFNKGLVPGLCFGAVSACFLSFSFVCLFVCMSLWRFFYCSRQRADSTCSGCCVGICVTNCR